MVVVKSSTACRPGGSGHDAYVSGLLGQVLLRRAFAASGSIKACTSKLAGMMLAHSFNR